MRTIFLDVECYKDYFLVNILNDESGKVTSFELFDGSSFNRPLLNKVVKNSKVVTFNGNNYDIPMVFYALAGANNEQLKRMSDGIILDELRSWQLEEKYNYRIHSINHIDIIEVAAGTASLKSYGGRLHCRKLQDLPIDPSSSISESDRPSIIQYCSNDLELTKSLYEYLQPQIDLRDRMSKRYQIDLRSKSDAQIAEAVFRHEVLLLSGRYLKRPILSKNYSFKYEAPSFLPRTDLLKEIEDINFCINETGSVVLPENLNNYKITIGSSSYRLGIGGIHSTEENQAVVESEDDFIEDRDVASYYPSIIKNCKLYPRHIGPIFLNIYSKIIEERLGAKHKGDKTTSDALKITLNGSYGKFGSKWSCLYSPDLLIHTTLTGQLSLIYLINLLEAESFSVVSANTDGVVIKGKKHRYKEMLDIVNKWEKETGFETEGTRYKAVYSRDVNNYIAVKTDGSLKTKGAYAIGGITKNPKNFVCIKAVCEFLTKSTPIEASVYDNRDIRDFVTTRKVEGGALYNNEYIGKTVRFYYSLNSTGCISYAKNGNKVPETDGAEPLMILPDELPENINYDYYIKKARSILTEIGVK